MINKEIKIDIVDNQYDKYKKHYYEPILINDHFQNYKVYNIPKAQLMTDIYNMIKNRRKYKIFQIIIGD